ncbi:hypothetical protein ACVBEJ_14465 [Porticoccus sp. GXU_MW_L64]
MNAICSEEQLFIHKEYLKEYAKEVFLSEKPLSVLTVDGYKFNSKFLMALSKDRKSRYGKLSRLNVWDETYKFQLDPCLRELLYDKKGTASKARDEQFAERRAKELSRSLGCVTSELKHALIGQNFDSIWGFVVSEIFLGVPFERFMSYETEGDKLLVRVQIVDGEILEVTFLLQLDFIELENEFIGALSVSVRVASSGETVNLSVGFLSMLPNNFDDVKSFESTEEFCVLVKAWKVLPVIINDLRKGGRSIENPS